MKEMTPNTGDALILDDRIRGVPPGTSAVLASEVGDRGWRPADGTMSLPVLTLDEAAFHHNRDLMLDYARAAGVEIAPHAKTPMAPDLARSLIEAGAWGATVADIRQATVMFPAGISQLLLANEVGGLGGARRLAALASLWPQAEINVFADSVSAVEALDAAWREGPTTPPLRVLVEVGAGRAGARSRDEAVAVAKAAAGSRGRLRLAGLAAYEGAAAKATPEASDLAIDALLRLAAEALADIRALAGPERPLLVTAGGSSFLRPGRCRAETRCRRRRPREPRAPLRLESSSTIMAYTIARLPRSTNGGDSRSTARLGKRGAHFFRPALRVWAEVLSP